MMKFWICGLSLTFISLFNACGGCPTREVTQQLSSFESYQVTIVNPPDPDFSTEVTPFNTSPGFQVTDSYINPNKPNPTDLVSFQFFFRQTALPDGEDIFDQAAGEIFNISSTSYDGQDVIYKEFAPQTTDYVPTSYSGTVSITDANHVQFDLTFVNGTNARRVLSTFFFQTATFDQPIGECE